ncbi:hypothetical protein FOMPIDRAFT_116637 [Fomitopsis schrenkii]|uniref:Uncharacterized protein n=1 Tax=Fomitopsis schrenkii TaxID=2126942 RepID=S8DVB4_FOMSC|nr:hypothetical protein FOMPIDRAFT_116637 [Fomitopsis schrenkii]
MHVTAEPASSCLSVVVFFSQPSTVTARTAVVHSHNRKKASNTPRRSPRNRGLPQDGNIGVPTTGDPAGQLMAPGPAQVPGLVDVNDVEQDMGDVPIDPALLVVPGPPAPTAANQQMLTNVIQNLQGLNKVNTGGWPNPQAYIGQAAPMQNNAPPVVNTAPPPVVANMALAPGVVVNTPPPVPIIANMAPTPLVANAALAPNIVNAAPMPIGVNAAPAPVGVNAAAMPGVVNAAAMPGIVNAAAMPGVVNAAAMPGVVNAAATPVVANVVANAAAAPVAVNAAAMPVVANAAAMPVVANAAAAPVVVNAAPVPAIANVAPVPGIAHAALAPLVANAAPVPVVVNAAPALVVPAAAQNIVGAVPAAAVMVGPNVQANPPVAALGNNNQPVIPRPKGTAGRDYNLREKMGLSNNKVLYCQIQAAVRDYTKAVGLDYNLHWRRQDPIKVAKMFRVARLQFDMLSRFAHCWPIDELAKAYCKRRRLQIYRKERLTAQGGTNVALMAAVNQADADEEFEGP